MARKTLIKVGALNISNDKEDEDVYRDALHRVFENKFILKVNRTTAIMLTQLDERQFSEDKFDIYGVLSRFTIINKNAPWLNLTNLKIATDQEKKSIQIPDNLKPNASSFLISFNLRSHTLFFEQYFQNDSISALRVAKFFNTAMSIPEIKNIHGAFNVNIIQERKAVEHLLAIHRIKKLTVEIARPNGDDSNDIFAAAEKRKRDEMAARNVKTERSEYVSLPSQGIEVDDDLKMDMKISTVNGNSVASGVDETGLPDVRSTVSMPKIVPLKFDPNGPTHQNAFDLTVDKYKHQENSSEDQGEEDSPPDG